MYTRKILDLVLVLMLLWPGLQPHAVPTLSATTVITDEIDNTSEFCPPTRPFRLHLMMVAAFDNNLSPLLPDLIEKLRLGTTQNATIVVTLLADGAMYGDNVVLEIARGAVATLPTIPWSPLSVELDTADEATLREFLLWARLQYPDIPTAVALLGHGVGPAPELAPVLTTRASLSSVAPPLAQGHERTPTDLSSGSYLSTPELGRALLAATDNGVNPFDLLFFDMCFMFNLDVLYEVRATAQVIVGSRNYAWGGFFYDRYLPHFDPFAAPTQWAETIITEYEAALDPQHPNAIGWVRGADIAPIAQSISALGEALHHAPADAAPLILAAALTAEYSDTTLCADDLALCPPDELMDAGAFVRALQDRFPADSNIAIAAHMAQVALQVIHSTKIEGAPWIQPHETWLFTEPTLSILAPLTPTLGSAPAWMHTIYTHTTPLPALWGPNPAQMVTISTPLTFTSAYRWDDFIWAWYSQGGPITPVMGELCHAFPLPYPLVQLPTVPITLTAIGGANGIELAWNSPDSPSIVAYQLERAEGAAGLDYLDFISVTTTYLDPVWHLDESVEYCYRVTGLYPGGVAAWPSNVACVGMTPHERGGFSGMVMDVGGDPLAGILATVYETDPDTGGREIHQVSTDANGAYEFIELSTTVPYRVRFFDPQGVYGFKYYLDSATLHEADDVSASGDITPDINAVLMPGGSIAGYITMSDATLAPDWARVTVYYDDGYTWQPLFQRDFYPVAGELSYTLGGLATGEYRLHITARYRGVLYAHWHEYTLEADSAAPIPVDAPATTLRDIVMGDPHGGHISGMIDSDVGPKSHMRVTAYLATSTGWEAVQSTISDADGYYVLVGLTPGTYRVHFSDLREDYAFEYYNNSTSLAEAMEIVVSAGAVVPGINATLAPGGCINGHITLELEDGTDIVRARVTAYYHDGYAWQPVLHNDFYVAAKGLSYELGGLPTGNYRLRIDAQTEDTTTVQWYEFAATLREATDISVIAPLLTTRAVLIRPRLLLSQHIYLPLVLQDH